MAVGHFKVSFLYLGVYLCPWCRQQGGWAWVGTPGAQGSLEACLPSSPCLHLVSFYKYSEKLPVDIALNNKNTDLLVPIVEIK